MIGVAFIFLGQAGTGIKGAYDVLVSMGVITYFIPYLFLFAAMLKLQSEATASGVIRVPGGKLVSGAGWIRHHDSDHRNFAIATSRRAQQASRGAQDRRTFRIAGAHGGGYLLCSQNPPEGGGIGEQHRVGSAVLNW